MNTIITENYLISKGFEKDTSSIGWGKFRKNDFELVEIPLKNGKLVIGFEYNCKLQVKYKYPITEQELNDLYKIIKKSLL